jgi:hypothetical protein
VLLNVPLAIQRTVSHYRVAAQPRVPLNPPRRVPSEPAPRVPPGIRRETSQQYQTAAPLASSGVGMRRAMRVPVDIPALAPTSRQRPDTANHLQRQATAPRPSTAPQRPPSARSAPRTPQSEPRPRSGSRLGLESSASGVGYIVRTSAIPGRVKATDPVAMRQQRERQW